MASSWKTKTIVLQGGIRNDIEPVMQEANAPGSLLDSQNMEAGFEGGYSRVKGYTTYSSTEVPGSNAVLGAFVFNDGVVACRGSNVYFGTGSTWGSNINPSSRQGAGKYRAAKYRWSEERIVLVDGTNRPMRYNGTSATNLSNAPLGATCVAEFNNHLFFGKGGQVTASAPDDDTTYPDVFSIGDTVQNFAKWRNALYILCTESIHKLTGDSSSNFAITPVTQRLGCPYPDTVLDIAGDIYYLSADGIRTISGTERSDDINLEVVSLPVKTYVDSLLTTYSNGSIHAIPVPSKSQYRLFFSASNVTATNSPGINMCFTKHEGGAIIEFHKLLGFQVACGDSGRINSTKDQLVVHGCQNGYIFKQETGDNFNGANISAYIKTPYYVFDDPAKRKTLYSLRAHIKVTDNSLAFITLQVNLDDNDTDTLQPDSINLITAIPPGVFIYGYGTYGAAIYGTGASVNYRTNPVGSGENIGMTFTSNDTNPPWNIRTMILEYETHERQ